MPIRVTWFLALGLFLALLAGCELEPDPSLSAPPLTRAQARSVTNCQHTIKTSSLAFYSTKLANLMECADKLLAIQIQFENGLLTESQFNKAVAKAQEDCAKNFAAVSIASKNLANEIIGNCRPVEDLIISSYDPLQFVALGAAFNGESTEFPLIQSVEDIIPYTCGGGELWMDLALWFDAPRYPRLFDDYLNNALPQLDSRCTAFFIPPT
ncbi:MAG TPA: hypothetical protein VGH50_13960 [Candidatus Binatia bacterium]|jgi:hypothetical protein